MLAGRSVGAVAGAERDLAEAEMVAELGPLGVGGFPVFLAGTLAAPLGDELPVMADHLFRVDRDIPLGGIKVKVAEQPGGDVDGQAAVDGLRGEDAAEDMPSEPQRWPLGVGGARGGGG